MIRAIVQNGVIRPIEPLPPDWQEGREVIVGIAPELSANGGAPETFVHRASRLDQAGHRDAALDLLYDGVDELMQRGEFGQLDAVLARLGPATLSTNLLLGVLTATLPARHSLPARRALLPGIEQALRSRGDYEEGLLTGLDD